MKHVKRKRSRFTDAQKRELLARVREGLSLRQVAKESGVQLQNLVRWRKQGYGKRMKVESEPLTIQQLKQENQLLKNLLLKSWQSNKAA